MSAPAPARAIALLSASVVHRDPGGFLAIARPMLRKAFAAQGIDDPVMSFPDLRAEGVVTIDGKDVDLVAHDLVAVEAFTLPGAA